MAQIKHVGKNGDRKVLVLYREVPGDTHMCLVIYPEILNAAWQDAIQKVVESPIGQAANQLADALHRSLFPDGRPILETLHNERMIKKIRTSDVIMTPGNNATIRLDELNKLVNEMEKGEEARKKMQQNDASRGMVDPSVKRAAEAEYKAEQLAKQTAAESRYTEATTLQAGTDGVLSDRQIAANMLAQAKQMEREATEMIAEASRMKKDAERMTPGVNMGEATWTPPVAEAPKRKGRPPKAEAAVSDAAN
jgi:tartrate dehydratase beta subunit/fumarate hydratase class I family protein